MLVRETSPADCPDIIAINHLAHSYAQWISRGDIARAAEVYAPDGQLSTPVIEPITGRAAIAAAIAEFTKDLEMIFHCVQNSLIEVDGDRAKACFQLSEWSKRKSDGATFLWLGFYEDELARLPEGWRFTKRTLVPRVMAHADVQITKVQPVDMMRSTLS